MDWPGPCRAALALAALCALAGPALAFRQPCWDCDIPYEWDDGEAPPSEEPPLPEGFVLTVPVVPGQTDASRQPGKLNRYAEVATALGRCWSSSLSSDDARWSDMTLRISFKRDGAINGVPRIVHVTAPADAEAQNRGRASLFQALTRCTPLSFSSSLGRAIAGQIFAIRFVQQRSS